MDDLCSTRSSYQAVLETVDKKQTVFYFLSGKSILRKRHKSRQRKKYLIVCNRYVLSRILNLRTSGSFQLSLSNIGPPRQMNCVKNLRWKIHHKSHKDATMPYFYWLVVDIQRQTLLIVFHYKNKTKRNITFICTFPLLYFKVFISLFNQPGAY